MNKYVQRLRFLSTLRRFSADVNAFSLRSHTCGELRLADEGKQVELYGWLSFKRMNRFIVLRDAYGSVQVTVPDDKLKQLSEKVRRLTYESAVKVTGLVRDRGQDRNPQMETGDIEVVLDKLEILSEAPETVALNVKNHANETVRLANRHLDLRSTKMQKNLRLRSQVAHQMRKVLIDGHGFVEVETPTLAHLTPGGAHEFGVACGKPFQGLFYSLPQSPQIFKQLLMCGGIDRYFQAYYMARCYRDEGAKPDRQPEFTQIDLEVSFSSQDNILRLIEMLIVESWPEELHELRPKLPFLRLTHEDVMCDYGIDKPDLRIPWKLFDCTNDLGHCSIATSSTEWHAVAFIARNAAEFVTNSLKTEWKRLLAMKKSTAQNFAIADLTKNNPFKGFDARSFISRHSIDIEDLVVFCWGSNEEHVRETLGQLRNYLGECTGIRTEKKFCWAWIVDFPLFVRGSDGQLESAHHPFTAPMPKYISNLNESKNLEAIKAQHYDLVVNGIELGGGSIRIHNADLQKHVLNILNLPLSSLKKFIDALGDGAPPHAGFALGLDRYVALLAEQGNAKALIRDVIAFPKTKDGRCLMMDSPAKPSSEFFDRYAVEINLNKESL